jgi:hypothetical protein
VYFPCNDISECERVGEEVTIYFKVLPNYLPGITEGNHENPVRIVCAMVEI